MQVNTTPDCIPRRISTLYWDASAMIDEETEAVSGAGLATLTPLYLNWWEFDALVISASNSIIGLDEIGSYIWGLCNSQSTITEIANRLTNEYEIDFDTALTDTLACIESLRFVGLIAIGQCENNHSTCGGGQG